MSYLSDYCQHIADKKNVELSKSIKKTAEEAYSLYMEDFSFLEHKTGLLFGNVQSGKTGQMFGVICKAADIGFPVFIILTTDNVILHEQTLERVREDLSDFCVCGEKDENAFRENEFVAPTVVVLKKNYNILKTWVGIINSTGYMTGNALFVIDDEADAASLNTLVNKGDKSSVNKYLDMIKESAVGSIYLQVTGTPQALLLQTALSGWHPDFVQYFKPGASYLGGDYYFPKDKVADCVHFVDYIEEPMDEVVARHLVVSSLLFDKGKSVCNCLVHPSVRQAHHEMYADSVRKSIRKYKENKETFIAALNAVCKDLPVSCNKELVNKCESLLVNRDTKVLILNGNYDVSADDYAHGCNFIIGGNTLGRGVTFPQLQTIVYTRTAKAPQADTMWQHSRMFGYDRDASLMAVYITTQLYSLFSDINRTNNALIAQVERGVQDIKVYYPSGLRPTRKNVLDNRYVSVISGGTNYYPANPDNVRPDELEKLLSPFDKEETYQIGLRLMYAILTHIDAGDGFNMSAFLSVLKAILAETPTAQGMLIVRRGRHVTCGTGALLSPNDWDLSNSFPNKPVLTMYRIEGDHGWKRKELWVPNIRLPENVAYYDVKEYVA